MGLTALITLIAFISLLVFLIRRNVLRYYVKPLFISYVFILFFSFGLYEIVISKQFTVIATQNEEESGFAMNLDEEAQRLYAAIHGRDIESVSYSKAQEEVVPFQASQLTIQSMDDEYVSVIILIERKEVDDHLIESSLYKPYHFIGEYNVMHDIQPVGLSWDNGILRLRKQPSVEIELATFSKEFTIRQFTGEAWFDIGIPQLLKDYQVLFLRVPKDVQIINQTDSFLYEMSADSSKDS